MFKPFEFCILTKGITVPSGPEYLHEIKYDDYRVRVERNGDRVRLITRGGYNWSDCYPWIVEAALKNRQKHFVIEISTRFIPANTMTKCSFVPSPCWQWTATICGICRSQCAKPIWPVYWHVGLTASS